MTPALRFFLFLCFAGAAAAQPQAAPGDARFDGTWNVAIICPKHTDGAFGYTYEFQAKVKDGRLRGEHGQEGRPSWLLLEGTLPADGNTMLRAKGLTGDQKFNVGEVRSLVPYSYRATAHFDDARGSGKRIELRACDLTFVKQ